MILHLKHKEVVGAADPFDFTADTDDQHGGSEFDHDTPIVVRITISTRLKMPTSC